MDYGYIKTLGEWLFYIHDDKSTGPTTKAVREELERSGVKVDGGTVKIANATSGIKAVYARSRWANGSHWRIIRRLHDADAGGNAWFAGNQSKCTSIPWKAFRQEDEQ